MDGSCGIIRTLGTLRIAFGNKVAKNDARVIGRLVPPLSPLTHEVRGDPIKKAPRKSEGIQDISSKGRRIIPCPRNAHARGYAEREVTQLGSFS